MNKKYGRYSKKFKFVLDIVPDEILPPEVKSDFLNRKNDHIKRTVKVKIQDKTLNDLTHQKLFFMLEKEKEDAEKERKRREEEQKHIENQKRVKQEVNKMGFKVNFKLNLLKNIKMAEAGKSGSVQLASKQSNPNELM